MKLSDMSALEAAREVCPINIVQGDVVPDPDEEYEIGDAEIDLSTSLGLLERAMDLIDDLLDYRMKVRNRVTYKQSEKMQELSTEIWNFMNMIKQEYVGKEAVTVVNLEDVLSGEGEV